MQVNLNPIIQQTKSIQVYLLLIVYQRVQHHLLHKYITE